MSATLDLVVDLVDLLASGIKALQAGKEMTPEEMAQVEVRLSTATSRLRKAAGRE